MVPGDHLFGNATCARFVGKLMTQRVPFDSAEYERRTREGLASFVLSRQVSRSTAA